MSTIEILFQSCQCLRHVFPTEPNAKMVPGLVEERPGNQEYTRGGYQFMAKSVDLSFQ